MKTPAPPLYSPRARGIGTGGACAWIALLVPKFAKARRRAPAWPMFEPGWPKHSAMTGGCSMAFPAVAAGLPRSRFRATTDECDNGGGGNNGHPPTRERKQDGLGEMESEREDL